MDAIIDTAAVCAEIESLLDQGKALSALQQAQHHWGHHQDWHTLQQLLVGARVFAHLGLRRKALACRFLAWRRYPADPEAIYCYVSGQLERRGPLRALHLLKRYGELATQDASLLADWLALKASVYSCYRDWETAGGFMAQAEQLAPDSEWIQVEKAALLERQDDYESAWAALEPLLTRNNRNAILMGAHLKTLQNDRDGAIALLQQGMAALENVTIPLRLSRLYQEAGRWPEAHACLAHAQSFVTNPRDLEQNLSIANFEQAMAEGDLARAAEALERIRSGFHKVVRENLQRADASKKKVLLEVPFVRQHHMTCAPATLSSLFGYWQQHADHLDIVEAICYDGTPNHAERRWAVQQGWHVREFCLEPDIAFALIDRGVPFTLSTVEPGSAHLQAVVGYDQRLGLYLVRDPYYPSIQEFLIEQTGEYYRSSGPRCLALVPADKAHLFDGLTFPDSEFYDAYYEVQEALDQHQRTLALQRFQHMQQQQADHRLTLMAERSLARYDQDALRELAVIDRLLQLFPQDINLQVSKAYVLGYLARFQEQIDYLEQQVAQAQPYPHPYLVEQLASALAKDNRQARHASAHLQYILYRQPTNAAALWMLAGAHWDLAEYEQAFEYYRLCSTLQDKHEGYVTSFFRAARYLKQTEKALQRLQQRIDHFGHLSIYPYESLYFALRELSREQEGIVVLEQARQVHPASGELVVRLARAYMHNGRINDAIQLCNDNKAILSELDRLRLAAEVAGLRNQWQKQVEYHEQILKRQPLNHYIIDQQATLLGRHQGDDAAVAFIERCLALNPRDRDLLFLKLDWIYQRPLAEREQFARSVVEMHPRDCEAYVRLARIQQQQRHLAEAEASAATACEINPYDGQAAIALGDILLKQEAVERAHQVFRSVVDHAVDTDGIFQRLLNCCADFEAKQAELRHIHAQLMAQTSYGNGILEYLDVARDLVQDEDLLMFLEQACELRPDLWQAWVARAMHLKTMDRLEEAARIIDEARRRFPLLPRVYLESGRIRFVAQQFDAALRDVQEALRQSPQWMAAITQSLMILEAQNRHEDALSQLQGYVTHMPTSAVLHGYLADTLMLLGRREEAIDAIEKALQLDAYYGWAWDRFPELAAGTSRQDRPLALAKEILQKQPHNVVVWQQCIELEPDYTARMALLEQALALHPKHEDLNLLKCNILFKAHQIQQIRQLVHDPKWKGNPPPALTAYEAWVEAKYQRFDEATTMMRDVVARHPYYYDGWRLLAQWAQRRDAYAEAVEFTNTCLRLAPHAPATLTMAAEIFLEAVNHDVKVEDSRINTCLEKAVTLDPRNTYNALTWLDYLIEKQDWAGVARARSIIHCDKGNPYFLVRYLQAAIRDHKLAIASEILDGLMRYQDDNEWLFETSYQEYARAELWDTLRQRLTVYLDDAECNPAIGRLWAQYCLDREPKPETILKYLAPFDVGSARWREAMEAVFARKEYRKQAEAVLRRQAKPAQADPRVWSLVMFHYARNELWLKARQWGRDHWQRQDNNAWAVYLYGHGLRLGGRWHDAIRVNEYAASLPGDDYYDRILIWQLQADSLANSNPVDEDRLARIRVNELAAVERYLLRLIEALLLVQQQGLPAAQVELFERLRALRKGYSEESQTSVAQYLHRQTRHRVVAHYQGSVLGKAWLLFRLYLLR